MNFKNTILSLILLLLFYSTAFSLSITHGPYLQELSDTGVTVMWSTDMPATGLVEFGTESGGNLNLKAEDITNGVMSVAKLHKVRLSGLNPGESYSYKVKSTEVSDFKPLFPVTGSDVTGSVNTFTTFNMYKSEFSFFCVTDIHRTPSDLKKYINFTDWDETDFLALTGDIIDDFSAKDSARIYSIVVDPCTDKFASEDPFLYIRGNHEYRGSLGPHLYKYFPRTTGEWYHSFFQGAAYFYVFDTGEDKKDASEVFGGYTKAESYLKQQQEWFRNHYQKNKNFIDEFPVKIAFVHDPSWGYGVNNDDIANDAGIDLMIGGHTHNYNHSLPGNGRDFHRLVLGRYMSAKVTVQGTTAETIVDVTVFNSSGGIHDSFQIIKGGMVSNKIDLNKTGSAIFATETAMKVNNGYIHFASNYKDVKKNIKIYSLNGRLLKELTTKRQMIKLSEIKGMERFAKGLTVVKVKTVQ